MDIIIIFIAFVIAAVGCAFAWIAVDRVIKRTKKTLNDIDMYIESLRGTVQDLLTEVNAYDEWMRRVEHEANDIRRIRDKVLVMYKEISEIAEREKTDDT